MDYIFVKKMYSIFKKHPSESCLFLCKQIRSSMTRIAENSETQVGFPLRIGKFESSTG